MKTFLHFSVLTFLLLSFACSYTGELTPVKIDQEWSIGIPDYMSDLSKENPPLHPTAVVQYGSHFRHFYMVVLSEPKTTTQNVSQYIQQEYNLLVSRLTKPQKLDSLTTTIGDLSATQISVTGTVGKDDFTEKMYYRLYFIEGSNKLYQIAFWTWDAQRESWLLEMDRIMASIND